MAVVVAAATEPEAGIRRGKSAALNADTERADASGKRSVCGGRSFGGGVRGGMLAVILGILLTQREGEPQKRAAEKNLVQLLRG